MYKSLLSVWNELPSEVKASDVSIEHFKSGLEKRFIVRASLSQC